MKGIKQRDIRKRLKFFNNELYQLRIKSILLNSKIDIRRKSFFYLKWVSKVKHNFFCYPKMRCNFTNRGRSIYSDLGLSRIELRAKGSFGFICGVHKSSW